VRANHTGQPLNDSTQVFGIHLMQFDCNRDVKHASTPLRSIREQTTAQHASKRDNWPASARGTFITVAVADDLAIKAEDCVPERDDFFVWVVP
jgi:hypothetical protein